ncbi:MAG: hypothetical protein EOM19_04645 [Candidatus Moranbacteria bacterium]|nr:hypothetical protein [Candidatus Moranbacteria bacterium]
MALDEREQFFTFFKQYATPLIILPENPSGEVLSAGYALSLALEMQKKEATLVFSQTFSPPQDFTFLPKPKEIRQDLSGVRDFVIIFNTSHNSIENVRTEKGEKDFRIYITPKKSSIDPRDFSFIPAETKYDCAFILGAKDKESLGSTYEENPDIFFEIPLINIDCQSNNERFAQTNIVDVTASSVSEIITGLFLEKEKEKYISEKIAQCLLAGIIIGTDSFQSAKTKPKSFQYSASLIDLGADQQEIVRHLYKTQPFHVLKLLGRVLTKLHLEETSNLVWTMVSLEDFVQSRSGPKDLSVVLEKVRAHYSSASHFLLLFQKEEGSFSGILRSREEEVYEKIGKYIQGTVQGSYFLFQSNKVFSESFIKEFVKNI